MTIPSMDSAKNNKTFSAAQIRWHKLRRCTRACLPGDMDERGAEVLVLPGDMDERGAEVLVLPGDMDERGAEVLVLLRRG